MYVHAYLLTYWQLLTSIYIYQICVSYLWRVPYIQKQHQSLTVCLEEHCSSPHLLSICLCKCFRHPPVSTTKAGGDYICNATALKKSGHLNILVEGFGKVEHFTHANSDYRSLCVAPKAGVGRNTRVANCIHMLPHTVTAKALHILATEKSLTHTVRTKLTKSPFNTIYSYIHFYINIHKYTIYIQIWMKHSTLAFTLAIAPTNVISSHGLTPKLCKLAIGSCSTFSW